MMKPLNDIILDADFSMDGSNLVEASAGTGKTYCIQTLFLRLVIEHGYEVRNILVVTFTDAATKELRDRLRTILQKFQQYCDGNLSDKDGDYDRVSKVFELDLTGDMTRQDIVEERAYRARCALLDFDESSISTIHGFCSKVLSRYAFECGHDFDAELMGNTDTIVSDLCEDWWRENRYNAGDLERNSIQELKLNNIKNAVKQYIKKPDSILLPELEGFNSEVSAMLDKVSDAARWWNEFGSEVKNELLASHDKGFLNENYVVNYPRQLDLACVDTEKNETELLRLFALYKRSRITNKSIEIDGLTPTGKKKKKNWSPGSRTKEFLDYTNGFAESCELLAKAKLRDAMLSLKDLYHSRREEMHVMSYDDLLLNLRNALRADADTGSLVNALREEYQVALIDEFQDTDPVQYEIFKSIFIAGERPVFLVGDPKQAIYKFRNGDIFTYYAAQNEIAAEQHYTLSCNYRSEQNLINGLNTIFGDSEEHISFLNKNISYTGDLTAKGKDHSAALLLDGVEDNNPFHVWYYRNIGDLAVGGGESPFRHQIYMDVAEEIVSLLQNDKITIGGRRLRPSDFAVLVLMHREATAINAELSVRNIPAVRQSIGNVFDSVEASDIYLFLNAMSNPGNLSTVFSLLATNLSSYTKDEIYRLKNGESINCENKHGTDLGLHAAEDVVKYFVDGHERWVKGSFIEAFSYICEKLGVKGSLMSYDNGERRLTNLLQLEELIHDAILQKNMGMQMTLNWFLSQLDEETREDNDAQLMRLESDSDAVQIMTVFKSKGLEFPVVFAPTLWRNKKLHNSAATEYHGKIDEADGHNTVPKLILDMDKNKEGKAIAVREQEEEDVRLLYVASTRGVHRTYLVWGDMEKKHYNSAIKHVLSDGDLDLDNCVENAAKEYGDADFTIKKDGVKIIVRNAGTEQATNIYTATENIIDIESLETADKNYDTELDIDKSYGHTSFSGIAPEHADMSATESVEQNIVDAEYTAYENEVIDGDKESINIFNFVAGAKTGTCWHSIFETLDFMADDYEIRLAVDEALDIFRLSKGRREESIQRKRDVVFEMVKGVLNIDLPCNCKLSDIAVSHKLAEMEFNFSLPLWDDSVKGKEHSGRRTVEITNVLNKHWSNDPTKEEFLERIKHWDKQIPQGFITGFIDLLFEHDGKYYIIDWKSNRCGGTPAGFSADGLRSEMAGSTYFLQYLIYTVALHNYLNGSIADYDYDTHFGGAIYVFLRGYNVVPDNGIYFDRPPKELIEDLSIVLGDF